MLEAHRGFLAMQKQACELLERIRHTAMPEGEVQYRATWVRQQGEMRLVPGRPWLPFVAQEWFEGTDIDFRWQAWVTLPPFLRTRVTDSFQRGRGDLRASVFGIVPIVRSRGAAADRGEAQRGIVELPWRPFSFRESRCLTWDATEEGKLRATFNNGKTQTTAEFEVDDEGHVTGGTAFRPRIVGKSVKETTWSGVFSKYRIFEGLAVPTIAEATWHLSEGPFTYWRGRVVDFRALR